MAAAMTDLVLAHSWDPPRMTQHMAVFYSQTPNEFTIPWVRTLCGRSILANRERDGAEMCEKCEEVDDA